MRNLYLSLMIFFISCHGASDNQDNQACENGQAEAEYDIKQNVIGLYFFGLPTPTFNTKVRLLSEKYGIVNKGGGDVVTEQGKCYNQVMEGAIIRKFGKFFFEKINEEVDSLFLLNLGDREVSFPDGVKGINNFLACNLNFFNIRDSSLIKPIVYVQLLIDPSGVVNDVSIQKGFNEQFDNEAIRVLKKMNGWIPAIQHGQFSQARVTLQIRFDPSMTKDIICP